MTSQASITSGGGGDFGFGSGRLHFRQRQGWIVILLVIPMYKSSTPYLTLFQGVQTVVTKEKCEMGVLKTAAVHTTRSSGGQNLNLVVQTPGPGGQSDTVVDAMQGR